MPQLPTNSTEDLGAVDEMKEYKHEDGEETENGTHLDLVNDIKSDLIKKETENSENPKPSGASSAPIAQLMSFPDRYSKHLNTGVHAGYPRGGPGHTPQEDIKHNLHRGHGPRPAGIFHPAHHHPYATAPPSATSLLCNKTCSYTLSVGRAVAKGAALYCTNIEKNATAPFCQLAEKCCWQSNDQLLLYKHALKSPHGKQECP